MPSICPKVSKNCRYSNPGGGAAAFFHGVWQEYRAVADLKKKNFFCFTQVGWLC